MHADGTRGLAILRPGSGFSILSTPRLRATPLSLSVLSGANFSPGLHSQFFDCRPKYENPFPIGEGACSLHTRLRRSGAAFSPSAGNCRRTSLTCMPNFEMRFPAAHHLRVLILGCSIDRRHGLFRLGSDSAVEKKHMQERISRGPPFTSEEREAILDYCRIRRSCVLRNCFPRWRP